MNQKGKSTSSYIKQPNSYTTSPRFSRRVLYCHKSTTTTEKYPTHVTSQDQDCQTDPVEEPLQRDYMEALRYINECHDVINQMYQQTRGNPRIPEVPNFIDLFMHLNSNRGNLTDIANQDLQQNISQTHCTLIDSPYNGSVNTNNNYQECSSPESDYELLAEPLKTYNKKQWDIKRAKCQLRAKHVLQDSLEDADKQGGNSSKQRNKDLDILYDNNVNWRVSEHGNKCQKQTQNSANDVRNKPQEISSLDFEDIIEELAQHAQQKYKKGINMQQAQSIEETSRLIPPITYKMQRSPSPCDRGEEPYQETDDSPIENSDEHYDARKQHSPNEFEQNSKHALSSPQCCRIKNSHDYEVPASKLLQKSQKNRAEQECRMRLTNNLSNHKTCHVREMKEKHSNEKISKPPHSADKLMDCKKKHSKEVVKKQCSDSDIDDEYYNDEHVHRVNKNVQRGCVNTTEERRAVIRPNRTELISTVKYGRKVVMRTELPPSEHPNFRQQRQSEEQIGGKCGGDSSDISSDPEFLMRQ